MYRCAFISNKRLIKRGGVTLIVVRSRYVPSWDRLLFVVRHFGDVMIRLLILSPLLMCIVGCGLSAQDGSTHRQREPIVGLPCEGCEAVFEGLGESLKPIAKITPNDEPGERMQIRGTVRNAIGNTLPGVIVYAYHTNASGLYPAHVHMHIIEVGRCTYYIDDILFDDDPRLTQQQRQQLSLGRGGTGIVTPIRDQSDVWLVTRDIVLGEKIPGYPKRD